MERPFLYIHGFASSGHSAKAQQLQKAFQHVYAPTLPHIPVLAIQTLEQFIHAIGNPVLIGSSLGGFYAIYLATRFDLPAVLINPVTYLDTPLDDVVGLNRSYFDGSRFEFTHEHLNSLSQYVVERPAPSRFLLLVQMGDELLDHRRTLRYLSGAAVDVAQQGDHGFSGFPDTFERIRQFLQVQRQIP